VLKGGVISLTLPGEAELSQENSAVKLAEALGVEATELVGEED
jgi:hypothetical protein